MGGNLPRGDGVLSAVADTRTRDRTGRRRRRLLAACRWRSASIDLREYVRAVEAVLERAGYR